MITDEVLSKLNPLYPQFVPAKKFLEIHFNNLNLMVHGPIALLNTGKVKGAAHSKQKFKFILCLKFF